MRKLLSHIHHHKHTTKFVGACERPTTSVVSKSFYHQSSSLFNQQQQRPFKHYQSRPKYQQHHGNREVNDQLNQISRTIRSTQHAANETFDRALNLVKTLETPDSYAVVLLYEIAARFSFEEVRRVDDYYEELSQKFPTLKNSPHIFSSKLNSYVKTGRAATVMEEFTKRCLSSNAEIEPDTLIYNVAMTACIQLKKSALVFSLFEKMKEEGKEPNARTLAMLIEYLILNDSTERAMNVYSEFCNSPNILSDVIAPKYNRESDRDEIDTRCMITNTLLKSIITRDKGKVANAQQFFDFVRHRHLYNAKHGIPSNLLVDSITYNTMIKAYYAIDNYPSAKRILLLMREDSEIDGELLPTLHTYNTIIDSHVQRGKPQYAFDVFDALIHDKNVKPNTYTFAQLVNACTEMRDEKKAKLVFEVMKQFNVQPDISVFSSMFKLYGETGGVEPALEMLSLMKERDVQPNAYCFVGVLKAYRRKMLFEEGWKFIEDNKLMEHGSLNLYVVSAISHLIRTEENLERFMQFFRAVIAKAQTNSSSSSSDNNNEKNKGGYIDFKIDEKELNFGKFFLRALRYSLFQDRDDVAVEVLRIARKTKGMNSSKCIDLLNQFLALEHDKVDVKDQLLFNVEVLSVLLEEKYPMNAKTRELIKQCTENKKRLNL